MDLAGFKASLEADASPSGLSLALQALWWDARGDWEAAHGCAQAQDDRIGAAAHAYLHRVEGDLANARYWYARAGRSLPALPLDAERDALITEFLGAG
jgi:hypothetical protein